MRKLGVVILSVIAAPILLVVGCLEIERMQVQAFYRDHPLLDEIIKAAEKSRPNEPQASMMDVLLKRVPLGTKRTEATRILASEKLVCSLPSSNRTTMLVCYPSNAPQVVGRWLLEVNFDASDEVSGGRVLRLK